MSHTSQASEPTRLRLNRPPRKEGMRVMSKSVKYFFCFFSKKSGAGATWLRRSRQPLHEPTLGAAASRRRCASFGTNEHAGERPALPGQTGSLSGIWRLDEMGYRSSLVCMSNGDEQRWATGQASAPRRVVGKRLPWL